MIPTTSIARNCLVLLVHDLFLFARNPLHGSIPAFLRKNGTTSDAHIEAHRFQISVLQPFDTTSLFEHRQVVRCIDFNLDVLHTPEQGNGEFAQAELSSAGQVQMADRPSLLGDQMSQERVHAPGPDDGYDEAEGRLCVGFEGGLVVDLPADSQQMHGHFGALGSSAGFRSTVVRMVGDSRPGVGSMPLLFAGSMSAASCALMIEAAVGVCTAEIDADDQISECGVPDAIADLWG
jgi:hypothetical protein